MIDALIVKAREALANVEELVRQRDTAREERDAAIKRAEELGRVGTQGWDMAKQLRAENEKLRGELVEAKRQAEQCGKNFADTVELNRKLRKEVEADNVLLKHYVNQLATIAEKTARERAVIDAAIAWNAAGNEHPGLGKTALALLKAIDALVTDAPSKPTDEKTFEQWAKDGQEALAQDSAENPPRVDEDKAAAWASALEHLKAAGWDPDTIIAAAGDTVMRCVFGPEDDLAPPTPESPAEPRLRPCDSPNCGGHEE